MHAGALVLLLVNLSSLAINKRVRVLPGRERISEKREEGKKGGGEEENSYLISPSRHIPRPRETRTDQLQYGALTLRLRSRWVGGSKEGGGGERKGKKKKKKKKKNDSGGSVPSCVFPLRANFPRQTFQCFITRVARH